MSRKRLRVALIGFGQMAAGYSADAAMAKYYRFATHAQVLREHPMLDWQVVVDNNPGALMVARESWAIPWVVSSIDELGEVAADIDLVVLSTPPAARLGVLKGFPRLTAVIAEKPLGENLNSAEEFLNECQSRGLLIQVNFWRRVDKILCDFVEGTMKTMIGKVMAVNCFYGNGLLNNGSHMVDMVRMLFGECSKIHVYDKGSWSVNGPIPGDINPNFALKMESGVVVSFTPIDFRRFRENGLIIWGTHGRLEILNEGLVIQYYPTAPNRAMTGERELANDAPITISSTVGTALYGIYDNLLGALDSADPQQLLSPGTSAIVTARLIDEIFKAVLAR